jgi:hypothetical protein
MTFRQPLPCSPLGRSPTEHGSVRGPRGIPLSTHAGRRDKMYIGIGIGGLILLIIIIALLF